VRIADFDSTMLSRVFASFTALKHEPDAALLRAYYEEVYTKLPLFDSRDLASALATFSSMRRLLAGDLLRGLLEEVAAKLPTFTLEPLGDMLLALGRLGYKPDKEWLSKVWRELINAHRLDCERDGQIAINLLLLHGLDVASQEGDGR